MSASQRSLDAARERVRAAGLDPDRPSDALAAREAAWGEDVDLDGALVRLAGESDEAGVGERLEALVGRTPSRELRREIKRALFRLTQRGRWSPAVAAPPPAAALIGSGEPEAEGWVTAFDPFGHRLLWVARRTGDGVLSATAITREDAGLEEFYAGETTRKSLRRAQKDATGRGQLALVEAPWAHVHRLVRRAWEATRERSRFVDVPTALARLAPRPPADVPHPVDAFLDRTAVASDEASLAASAAVLSEPELASWLVPAEWVEPAARAVHEAGESVVVVSPAHQRERVEAAVSRAVEELWAEPARRERFAVRLEETAYLLARRGDLASARAALAAALAMRAGRPAAEIPVLAELARRSLSLALARDEERAREEARSSLVVTPAQALAEEQRRQQRLRGR